MPTVSELLRVGDIVSIRGLNAPRMVIGKIDTKDLFAECVWFNDKCELFAYDFHFSILERVKE